MSKPYSSLKLLFFLVGSVVPSLRNPVHLGPGWDFLTRELLYRFQQMSVDSCHQKVGAGCHSRHGRKPSSFNVGPRFTSPAIPRPPLSGFPTCSLTSTPIQSHCGPKATFKPAPQNENPGLQRAPPGMASRAMRTSQKHICDYPSQT